MNKMKSLPSRMAEKAAKSSRSKGGVAGLSVGQLPGEEGQGGPGLLHILLEYSTYVCICGIHCKGDRSTRDGMHKDRHGGENVSSTTEGCIQRWSPIQQFARALEGIGEGGQE